MSSPILLACRSSQEADEIRQALNLPALPSYHYARNLLERFEAAPNQHLLMTPLLKDDTALGILSKCLLTDSCYAVVYAKHLAPSLSLIALYASGVKAILGPDELQLALEVMQPSPEQLENLVFPPNFIDIDVENLLEPSPEPPPRLHLSCLGDQALQSACNAIQRLPQPQGLSIATAAPENIWARVSLLQELDARTLWDIEGGQQLKAGQITFYRSSEELAELDFQGRELIICHGLLSAADRHYLSTRPTSCEIYVANFDGYIKEEQGNPSLALRSSRFWRHLWTLMNA